MGMCDRPTIADIDRDIIGTVSPLWACSPAVGHGKVLRVGDLRNRFIGSYRETEQPPSG